MAGVDLGLPPRLTDWTVLVTVLAALATGLGSLWAGRPGDWWVYSLHGVAGIAVLVPLFWKLRRVRPRITRRAWSRSTALSVVLAVVAVGAVLTGVAWTAGVAVDIAVWNLLNLHVLLGIVVAPLLAVHLWIRFRLPDRASFEGRRTLLTYAAVAGAGVVTWGLQRALNRLLGVAADRRFTGSRERGSFAGNAFPTTAWMADDPDPVDPEGWHLGVVGAVDRPYRLGYDAIATFEDRETATLDCTSGWYSHQEWEGVRVGRLLDRADASAAARYVSFRSTTGYRWSLPIEEARGVLLATRVGGDRLAHGHGFPARLVAPGRRGFQWVKWVDTVEVRRDPDPGQWAAIFVSWL